MTSTSPPAAEPQDACASDPNFAAIFAFCERFGDSCGIAIPTFQELQDMLEKTNEVPDTLVNLHIKLLRRVKKSVHVDKWEKAILKFCQAYSIPEFWELENYGYKGISVKLKLRILKTLLEAQFDSNVKFKAEINKLESSTLRSQPLGWDKSGTAYWVQFDRACNLRVYKEDSDEHTWKIVAKDRSSLVNLINELSGSKDYTLDDIEDNNSIETSSDEVELSSNFDQEKLSPASPSLTSVIENNKEEYNKDSKIKLEKEISDSIEEHCVKEPNYLKKKLNENFDEKINFNNTNSPIVGETIEESVMIVKGEGSGQECDTGNPDEPNAQNETAKNEDIKKPKLWSIDTICSSSKEVKEEIISVPKTGFFFGDDSVPCFNNVSNGESSHLDDENLKINSKEENKELKTIVKLDEFSPITEVDSVKSINKEYSTKNEEEFVSENTLKQSVFNIKIHEEEIQITERKANEVFIKSDSNVKNNTDQTNSNEPMLVDSHSCKTQTSQLTSSTQNVETNKELCKVDNTDTYNTDCNVNQNNTEDKHDLSNVSEEVEYKKIDDGLSGQQSTNIAKFDVELDKHTVTQETLDIQLEKNKDEIQLQSTTSIDDKTIKTIECNSENSLEIKTMTKSKVNQSNKEEKIDNCHEKFKANESLASVVDYYTDNNEQQNVESIIQNQSKLDNTTSNEINFSGNIADDQILTRVGNVIDNKETIQKLTVEDSKQNEQMSDDVKEHTMDNLETNATYLTDDFNQHSEIDNSIINETDSSSSSKVHDQIITGDISQCLKTSNQINNDQNITPKITSHNIRNIIATEVVNDSVKANEQLINIDDNKNKQMESCQSKNESNFVKNVFQEENKLVPTDSQIVSNSKHNLNKLFKKSNEVEIISENFISIKEKTKTDNLLNEPGYSNIEMNKSNVEKSEISVKQKAMDVSNDLTIVKDVLTGDKKITEKMPKSESSSIEINTINIDKSEINIEQSTTKTVEISNNSAIVKEVLTEDEKNSENISESLNSIKEKTEKDNLLNELGSSNIDETNIEKSEIGIKQLKPKTIETSNDLTIVKEDVLTIDERNTEKMPESLNFIKEKSEKDNLLNELGSSSVEINKINIEKSDIGIKQSKTIMMDISNNSVIVKEVLTGDEKNTEKIPKSLNSIKEQIEKVNLKNEPGSSSIEGNKIIIEKSEINIKQSKTKTMDISNDLMVVKEVLTGDKKNTDKVPDNLNSVKEKTEKNILLNEPEFSSININKINTEKSEIVTKVLKVQNISNDLMISKEELTEDRKNSDPFIQSVSNQKEIVNIIDQIPKGHMNSDENVTISSKQCLENEIKQKKFKLNLTETVQVAEKIQLNKSIVEKQKLIHVENKIEECKEKLEIVFDKNNVQDIVNKSSSTIKSLDKINSDDILQNENIQNKKEECILNISKEEHIVSPTPTHESADDNDEALIEDHKCDNNEMINQTIEESDNKNEEIEEMPKKKGRPGRKKGKRGRAKNITVKKETKIISENKVKRQYKPRQKKVVSMVEEVIVLPEPANDDNVRRSRRIAEIKIKEQVVPNTQYDDIDIPLKALKKKEKVGKKISSCNKKVINVDKSDDEDDDSIVSKKFKRKKKKGKSDSLKKINVVNPWNVDSESSSSENNLGLFEDYDHEEEDEIPRPGIEPNVSDHEFSPESDINEDDDEYFPEKRARTAHKEDQGEELDDDMSCKKCNKSDQPEWILLCDTCNQGWHASCLRPALMAIPDGDWYCPLCRHETLLNALKDTLKRYDGESKKRENEELRRKRLEYVGISLQNVIPSKTEDIETKKEIIVKNESSEDEEDSESESYDSEPLYQLRARRQANVSYRFNDYDNMIDEAIFEETGVDESASRKLTESKMDKKSDHDEKTDSDNDDDSNKSRDDSPIAPALLHLRGRKKSKKLTNLDISSDDGSDEDFKGPSDGDDDYDEDLSEYSDDSVKRRPQPTRRSVRSRKTVVDPDFINDDSSEESDNHSKKKRSRPWSNSSNSEEEDFTWGRKKKKRTVMSSSSSYKQPKGSKRKHNENRKQKSSKIKYGMDSDSDDQPQRRTRGRQITYAESDDSEVEIQTKKRKILSDEEDEYVLNDEELEVENEDHNLETEEEDTVVSNEENNKEETDDEKEEAVDKEDEAVDKEEEEAVDEEEEAVDEEEEAVDKEDNEGEEEEEENGLMQTTSAKVLHQIVKSPSADSAVFQSVIRESITVNPRPNTIHRRLLPEMSDKQIPPQLSINPATTAETLDKRKRPVHQQKKCPSPNPPVDYAAGGCYPCPPDATKVVTTVPLLSAQHTVSYNRPPMAVSNPASGFKPMAAATLPSQGGLLTAPYRTTNKNVTETVSSSVVSSSPAYHTPQVQQVYQAPMPTNYSSYPIDYATAGTTLPTPLPPTIPFRNVVVAPTQLHDPQLPLTTTLTTQQPSVSTTGGDSEFGGLVSYFSSQQEDDFDV